MPPTEPIPQDRLEAYWHSAPIGRLCPWEQAKALAFREASKEIHHGAVKLDWVAGKLTKNGGGCPQKGSLSEFFAKVDADPAWFPGKHCGAKRGRRPCLTASKRRCIAKSLMAAKKRGEEPCPEVAIERCPKSTMNQETGEPFCAKTLRKVMSEDCYDVGPAKPWRFQTKLQKVFLPEEVKAQRCRMAEVLLSHGHDAAWWYRNVVWFDPCSSILPGSMLQWLRMRQAAVGDKAWLSDDAKEYSRNLRGSKYAKTQRTWAGYRVNWFVVLARGKIHVEVMPAYWPLDSSGVATFVERLPRILRCMLGCRARLPSIVFTDRGTGMYSPHGAVTQFYDEALTATGFSLYWGADASVQAPDMPDVLLHETAVAMFRNRLRREKPVVLPWLETQEQWAARAEKVVEWMNANCNLVGLCRKFPERLHELLGRGGDRLVRN